MAYPVESIIPVNVIISPSGLGYANFSSAFIFADSTDLAAGVVFDANTYRDYATTAELAVDFGTDSDVYHIATRYFAQIPKPPQISVWMQDTASLTDTIIDAANRSADQAWRYHQFFKVSDLTEADALALGDWGDANSRAIWATYSASAIFDPQSTTDIMSVLQSKGNRHMFAGFKSAAQVATDPSQAYAMCQLAAAFHKFRPNGLRTAITGEFQVLPGVMGDDLSTTAYNALTAKNGVFFTQIELAGQTDNSRVINSKSMSSFGEFIDDVVNLDVLKNYLQVDGYNYIANKGTKSALEPRDYGGLLETLSATCKKFYDNGVLGEGTYTDPLDGVIKVAKFGFVIMSKPEDVLSLSAADRRARKYPATTIIAILSRAAHVAEINVNVA
jgi:hypothetical protein